MNAPLTVEQLLPDPTESNPPAFLEGDSGAWAALTRFCASGSA